MSNAPYAKFCRECGVKVVAPTTSIGLLDAFGFELLQSNSFEQLLINTTNEQLQQLFLQRVLKAEQLLYEAEGITLSTTLEFTDNAPTLAVLLGKPRGQLALLNGSAGCLTVPTRSTPRTRARRCRPRVTSSRT